MEENDKITKLKNMDVSKIHGRKILLNTLVKYFFNHLPIKVFLQNLGPGTWMETVAKSN